MTVKQMPWVPEFFPFFAAKLLTDSGFAVKKKKNPLASRVTRKTKGLNIKLRSGKSYMPVDCPNIAYSTDSTFAR